MCGLIEYNAATKKNNVMKDTWGHTYPEGGSKHKGYIYISTGNSTCNIIHDEFPTLCGSPMRCELVSAATDLFDLDWDKPAIYKIDCELWFFKSCSDMYVGKKIGRIIKPKLSIEWECPNY